MRACLLVLAACSASSPPPARPAAPPAPPMAKPASVNVSTAPLPDAERIEAGKPVAKTIKRGEVHRYRVDVPAGNVVTGAVVQDGIDVEVVTFDATGKELAHIDSPNGRIGPEPFVIFAETAGGYDFEVRPLDPLPGDPPDSMATEGKYEARVEVVTRDAYDEERAKERFGSERVRELWRAVRTHQQDAVDKLYADLAGKSPIVEPYPGDPKDVLVSFVLRAKSRYVGIVGANGLREKPLLRLGDSDMWTISMRMPRDARFSYAFIVTDNPPPEHRPFRNVDTPDPRRAAMQLDPNNPAKQFNLSRAELPGAGPQPWIEPKSDVPHGTITRVTMKSKALSEERKIGVYTPAGYDKKKRYPLVIAFDGEVYGLDVNQLPLPTILDNLIAAKKIPPVVAVLVASQDTRNRDLPGSAPFSTFVATELVPKLRAEYNAGMTAAETIVTGSSFGGLCSAYTALHHSDVIGNVLSNSGSYQFRAGSIGTDVSPYVEGGWLTRDYAAAKKLPVRFYLDAGLFEDDLLKSNRQMRDVLVAKGYSVTYAEFSGGHDYWMWRQTIADGLIALLTHANGVGDHHAAGRLPAR